MKNNRNNKNDGFNFRPQYGSGQSCGSRGFGRGRNFHRGNNNPSYRSDYSPNYNNSAQRTLSDTPASLVSVKDDETRAYAVNLQLKPVEMGIRANSGNWKREFRGIGAFNHYFGLCAPTNGLGYTLADVWDGYFHITLAKFFSELKADALEEVFRKFDPSLEDIPSIPRIVFRTTSITSFSGEKRGGNRKDIPFIVLPIDHSPELNVFYNKIQSLLIKIKTEARVIDKNWDVTPYDKLHVTVRKYSKINFPLEKIKVHQFPLEFRCSHLEIRQPRELAIQKFKQRQNNNSRWWIGVTETREKICSGCNALVTSDVWEGFCLNCGKYETVWPLWMTQGNQNFHSSLQQETIQNNAVSQCVSHLEATNIN